MKIKSIKLQNYRLIESELYHYNQTKRELEELRNSIIDYSGHSESGVRSGIGNPTEAKASKLLTSTEILEITRRVEAIEYMIKVLNSCDEPNKLKMVEMKYFENRFTDIGIWENLNISKKTFYRWKNEAIGLIAGRLGYQV